MHLREFLADLDKIGPLGKVTGWMDGWGVGGCAWGSFYVSRQSPA
jgi:hypothetical protein